MNDSDLEEKYLKELTGRKGRRKEMFSLRETWLKEVSFEFPKWKSCSLSPPHSTSYNNHNPRKRVLHAEGMASHSVSMISQLR